MLIITFLVVSLMAEDASINIGITGGMNMAGINGTEVEAFKVRYDHNPYPRWFGAGGVRIGYSLHPLLELESGLSPVRERIRDVSRWCHDRF